MPPGKSPDEARAHELAQKSESMARELSQKRELRIRQERVRQLSGEEPLRPVPRSHAVGATADDDRTQRLPERQQRPSPAAQVEPRSTVDDVAVEIEELVRDVRSGLRRLPTSDRITLLAAGLTVVGVLLPWVGDARTHTATVGLAAGGALHAALAVAAAALVVGRVRGADSRGTRMGHRERAQIGRRTSLWHLLLGALSTVLCMYFLVFYGAQRSSTSPLEIRFGLYVTLAAGMGLAYGGFSRFLTRHGSER